MPGKAGTVTRKYLSYGGDEASADRRSTRAEKLLGSAKLVQYADIISIQTTLGSITFSKDCISRQYYFIFTSTLGFYVTQHDKDKIFGLSL